MSTANPVLVRTFPAAEDLTADQYRIVVLTSTGTVRRPDGATEVPLGILQNAPASGEGAVVMLIGVSKCVLGEAVVPNEWVKLEYNSASDAGKGLDADAALDLAIGRCLVGGAEDELAVVLLSGAVHQVNAAS